MSLNLHNPTLAFAYQLLSAQVEIHMHRVQQLIDLADTRKLTDAEQDEFMRAVGAGAEMLKVANDFRDIVEVTGGSIALEVPDA